MSLREYEETLSELAAEAPRTAEALGKLTPLLVEVARIDASLAVQLAEAVRGVILASIDDADEDDARAG